MWLFPRQQQQFEAIKLIDKKLFYSSSKGKGREGMGWGSKWIEGAIIYSCKSERQTKLFTTLLGIEREEEIQNEKIKEFSRSVDWKEIQRDICGDLCIIFDVIWVYI